mmetsp:Transcript_9138/g.18544  ORF Transcript_9138/g.18544 Transcript_9138/m.18544 type:complete len:213 (+) Transcript_9138:971-1609(+)
MDMTLLDPRETRAPTMCSRRFFCGKGFRYSQSQPPDQHRSNPSLPTSCLLIPLLAPLSTPSLTTRPSPPSSNIPLLIHHRTPTTPPLLVTPHHLPSFSPTPSTPPPPLHHHPTSPIPPSSSPPSHFSLLQPFLLLSSSLFSPFSCSTLRPQPLLIIILSSLPSSSSSTSPQCNFPLHDSNSKELFPSSPSPNPNPKPQPMKPETLSTPKFIL